MEKILVIVAILFAPSVFAQFGASMSCSLSTEKIAESGLKDRDRLGQCLNLFYYLPEGKGIGLQFRNRELWKYGSEVNSLVLLKTAALQFFLYEFMEGKASWFPTTQVGLLAALGRPVYNEDPNLQLLKTGYFSGVFLELGTGTRLEKFLLIFSVKSEGILGVIRDGNDGRQSTGANGFISINLKFKSI